MLPLHHRRGQQDLRASLHEQSPPKTDDENPQPQGRWLKEFIIAWIKMSWKDVLAMLLLGGAMEGVCVNSAQLRASTVLD